MDVRYATLPDSTRKENKEPFVSKINSSGKSPVESFNSRSIDLAGAENASYSSKVAEKSLANPVKAREENAYGSPGEQKEQKYASVELRKLDSANEELMRFRRLRQALREDL